MARGIRYHRRPGVASRLIQAKSKAKAVEWARRVPFVDGEVEVRQVFELEDFGAGDAIEHHRKHRDQLGRRQ